MSTGDDLDHELDEIDENLVRHDLSVVEQSRHVARREEIMRARGERRRDGRHPNPPTVGGLEKTTDELAKAVGMAPRTYQQRAQIGRGLTEETQGILAELDPADSDLPNSTRQLNYLAGVDDPEDQAEMARRVAAGEAGGGRGRRVSLPFFLPAPSNNCSMRPRKERDVDVARASDQIDALIDKRAVARAGANFEEMAWKASVRRHHQKLQRARRAEWFEFYSRLASSLRRSAEEYESRAEQLLEEGDNKWGA